MPEKQTFPSITAASRPGTLRPGARTSMLCWRWKLSSTCAILAASSLKPPRCCGRRHVCRRHAQPDIEELRIGNRGRRICPALGAAGDTQLGIGLSRRANSARALRGAGLRIADETGVVYDPLTGKWRLSHDMDINYIIAASRPE